MPRLAILALFACMLLTACAGAERAGDRDRPGGFYGGMSGGVTR